MKFGRIDRAQTHPGVDLEAGPDAHPRFECVAVDDTQHFGRVDGLRIELSESVAGPRERAALARRGGERISPGGRVDDRADQEPQSGDYADNRQHAAERSAGPPMRQIR